MEFSYTAQTKTGQILEGVINAPDENVAVGILHGKGYVVLALQQLEKDIFAVDVNKFLARITNKDIVVFTRQLSTLIDADMPITESLKTLARQTTNPKFRSVVSEIAEEVEGGASLSSAFGLHPNVFSSFYIKLVQSGEVSGKLHDSLLYLADHLERSQAINSKLRGALAYPAFIFVALIIVGAIMAIYVLPQLLAIFEEAGVQDLPITTKALIWTTAFVNDNLLFIILSFVGLATAFAYYLLTEEGKRWFDRIKIAFPIIGPIVRNLYLARISESLSTLMKSGIPILDSMRITGDIVGNKTYREIMKDAEGNVRGGGNMSTVFARYEEIPPLFASMVAIGEKTGKLDFILEHIARFYKQESENAIQTLSQLLEPVIVLILGVAVAVMVSSILLPIYNLVGAG